MSARNVDREAEISRPREVNTKCRQEWLEDRMSFRRDGTVSVC